MRKSARSLPSTLVMGMASFAAIAGGLLITDAIGSRRVREASVGGLYMRLEIGRWLVDQMDHGQTYAMPESMMPDMPVHGTERFSAELILLNRSERVLSFSTAELELRDDMGTVEPPLPHYPGQLDLKPGEIFNTVVFFDYELPEELLEERTPEEEKEEAEEEDDEEWEGDLKLVWSRDGTTVDFLIPHPPSHHDGEEPIEDWPDLVTELPQGDPQSGESLYMNRLGCISCHGHPKVPGTAIVGPPLGDIANVAATREEGQTPPQYLYESIVYPNTFIVEECPNGKPCATPSAMPDFRSILTLETVADLIAYLLQQKSTNS